MFDFVPRFIDRFIPDRIKQDGLAHLKGRLMVQSFLMVIPLLALFAAQYIWLDHPWGVLFSVYGWGMAIFGIWHFSRYGNFAFAGNAFSFTALVVIAGQTITVHGLDTVIAAWIIMVPISGFLLVGLRSGIFWSLTSVLTLLAVFVMEQLGLRAGHYIAAEHVVYVNVTALLGLVGYIVLILLNNDLGKGRLVNDLRRAKADVDQKNALISASNRDLEAAVNQRTERLQAANDELDTFLYESSHALRRPLVRIQGLMNLLTLDGSPEDRARFMDMIDYTAQNMDKMLQDLLLVSEIYNRKLASQPIAFQTDLEKLIPEHDATVQVVTDIQPGFSLDTDTGLLHIVLQKLLDNALVFRRSDAMHVVRIEAGKEGPLSTIRIIDNGIGIDATVMPQLFKMFARGTAQSRGSGLGLFIVGKALERLGGKIHIDSTVGAGTVVTLTFGESALDSPEQGAKMAVA